MPVAWRASIGPGWSSPVIADSRVVVTDVEIADGVATERILCFDEAGGSLLWSHEYVVAYPDWARDPKNGGGPRATPLLHQGHVFALGALGHLFCLELRTGEVRWSKDLAQEYGVKEFTGITRGRPKRPRNHSRLAGPPLKLKRDITTMKDTEHTKFQHNGIKGAIIA